MEAGAGAGGSEDIRFAIKWSGREIQVSMPSTATVGDLKRAVEGETSVLAKRQKLTGLPKSSDDALLSSLKIKRPVQKLMLIGSAEKDIQEVSEAKVDETVVDDLAFDVGDDEDDCCVAQRPENVAKLEVRIEKWKPNVLNPSRTDCKLLVLDIDYTLFDHRSSVETPAELMRPFLHEFLTVAYNSHFDIIIWSATSMKWVELKMKELGVTDSPNFKIVTLVDSSAMITVTDEKHGTFNTKPLGTIWAHFPQYSPRNTLMFDDLRRNFIMNPQTGLKIRPCRNLPVTRDSDEELLFLSKYLLAISSLDDFTKLDHRRWERYLEKHTKYVVNRKGD
jgi:ubiquitin-like domain-containing CTD phosphatase 1